MNSSRVDLILPAGLSRLTFLGPVLEFYFCDVQLWILVGSSRGHTLGQRQMLTSGVIFRRFERNSLHFIVQLIYRGIANSPSLAGSIIRSGI